MNLTDAQIACIFVFGPLTAAVMFLAAIHAALEIHTQRTAHRGWAPVKKDRRHG